MATATEGKTAEKVTGRAVNDVIAEARLPVPQTVVAERLMTKLPEISTIVHGIDPGLFLGACISEANLLRLTMTDDELKSSHVIGSFVRSVFNAAVIGLVPGSVLGHCFFIPFKNRKVKGTPKMIQLVLGYRGLLHLGFSTGYLVQCDPQVVLTGEFVELCHTESGPKMKHDIPALNRPLPDRTNIEAAYCTYRTRGGGMSLVFVGRDEIAKVDTNQNVWRDNYHAMCLKTPIRRASKVWQLTRQLAAAVRLDEQADAGLLQDSFGPGRDEVEEPLDYATLVDTEGEAAE